MNDFAKFDSFIDTKKEFSNVRLKLRSDIDGYERTQSRVMNGFVSNTEGKFMYPDGFYYQKGTQPGRWSINDREELYEVFLNNEELKNESKRLVKQANEIKQVTYKK